LTPQTPSEPQGGVEFDPLILPELPALMVFTAASILQIPAMEKQHLLEIVATSKFLDSLLRIFKREISLVAMLEENNTDPSRRSGWLN
jgi:hypothetical protein